MMDSTNEFMRIHGKSGALRELLEVIDDSKVNSLKDVLQFRSNYAVARKEMINDSIAQVKQQILKMMSEMNQLTLKRDELTKSKSEERKQKISCLVEELSHPNPQYNILTGPYYKIRRWIRERKLEHFRNSFQEYLRSVTKGYNKQLASKESKIKYTESNVEVVAIDNICSELHWLDELNNTIGKERYLVYGAIGETKVINELRKLPDTYYVINDLSYKFNRPIYNRSEDDRIYSIQVDHLVVGPTGIYIIETKYWSNSSISNEMLFSPVKQVKRAGFALFVILNDAIKLGHIKSLISNWGERKISPKKVVASVKSVPHAEFQFVKVLGIDQLNSYITYGKKEYTTEEIQDIVSYLLRTN